ncbi:MAG: hypothetical protein ABSB63_02710 [Spirochaetia bacterium]
MHKLPGFGDDYHFSLLPFWGNHCLVDFMLANFGLSRDVDVTIVLDESARAASLALSTRWKRQMARVHLLEGGLEELVRLVDATGAEQVVLASLSSVSILEPAALLATAADASAQLVKISVMRTPIEMYCAGRAHLCKLLLAAAGRAPGKRKLRECLFEQALHSGIDLIEDLPGELLFQNDLMDYYTNNLWVISHCGGEGFQSVLARLPALADKGAESHITEKGSIRNSWLASGVEVEGAVEDSIIFPNVVIKRNTLISRSVVLNGNRIGAGAEIHNTLILPFTAEVSRSAPNIGDNCAIGARTSSMKNSDFPGQIRDGISVIGTNVDLPSGFRAEAATYVAPGVPPSVLRRAKVLRKGSSALVDNAAPGPGRVVEAGNAR